MKKTIMIQESTLRKLLTHAASLKVTSLDQAVVDVLDRLNVQSRGKEVDKLLGGPVKFGSGAAHHLLLTEFDFVIMFPQCIKPELTAPIRDSYGHRLDEGLGTWIGKTCSDALKRAVQTLQSHGFREFGIYERSTRFPLKVTPAFRWEQETEAGLGMDGGYESVQYVTLEQAYVPLTSESERHGQADAVSVEEVLGFRW